MLRVHADFQFAFARLALASCADVVRYFRGGQPPAAGVWVTRATLPLPDGRAQAVFYKQYEYARPAWRFLGRPSKARREFGNYEVFARLGVASAQALACGEERDGLGRLRRAFILTAAIPDAVTLPEFFQGAAARGRAGAKPLRAALLAQLADATRRIHDAGFFHRDLVWRNLLVTWTPPAAPQLWWIDCPRGGFDRWSPWRRRRRLKDLASLDKVASQLCPAGERVRFVRRYLGVARLGASGKAFLRAALAYRRRRWPDEGR